LDRIDAFAEKTRLVFVARSTVTWLDACLERAMSLYNNKSTNRQGVDLVKRSFQEYEQTQGLLREGSSIVLIAVDETILSLAQAKLPVRTPCGSIKFGYELLGNARNADEVYFLVRRGSTTGLDVLTLFLSGARGVIDMEAMVNPEVIESIVNARSAGDTNRFRYVVGGAYLVFDQLLDLYSRITSRPQWEIMLTLCEVPHNRLIIDDAQTMTNKAIVRALSKPSAYTVFLPNTASDRNVGELIAALEEELEQISVRDSEKSVAWERDLDQMGEEIIVPIVGEFDSAYLPLYVRQLGFPARLLPIRDVEDSKLVKHLYDGLSKVGRPRKVRTTPTIIGRFTLSI